MEKRKNNGISRLAGVLVDRMKETATSPQVLDFATVNDNQSITPYTFPVIIPSSDYSVTRTLSEHGGKVLQAGDVVLIAWVKNEIVIIDVVVGEIETESGVN